MRIYLYPSDAEDSQEELDGEMVAGSGKGGGAGGRVNYLLNLM